MLPHLSNPPSPSLTIGMDGLHAMYVDHPIPM